MHRRATLVESPVRGRRVLWIDDCPSNNSCERVTLAEIGLIAEVAVSSEEGLHSARWLQTDAIVSDIEPGGERDAGLQFLNAASAEGIAAPVIFYVGGTIRSLGAPIGAFAITDRPDESLHWFSTF